MWLLKLLSLSSFILACTGYEYDEVEYDNYYEDESPNVATPRAKRYPSKSTLKTLNAQEMQEVKEALKQLLSNSDENAVTSNVDDGGQYEEVNITTLALEIEPIVQYLRLKRNKDKKTTTEETTTDTIETTLISTPSTRPTAKWPIDVPALLDLIAVLAEDYETNLTKKLNESLSLMSIPTCETFTPFRQTTSEYDANATGTVIAKCFVCGLEETGVPRSAPCADAFAGDFIPMVPVDPTARAQISKFRKYCKYQNIRGYKYNSTQPRAIFGRWTGGCAVRWIDLSGIYTQRTCRSRHQAIMGQHFGSKRMARLEMSLMAVDNGCIVSPMATLVPLSRGISLFARFHACVCTGSWCNNAARDEPWIKNIFLLLFIMYLDS
ncbi:unnamed protein product [Leptosia nina]|uniref:Uncharacterized protein n=1 Tax=Leptosia nina TaxID=320188 RepID=A0AAV1JKH2_9NEOP